MTVDVRILGPLEVIVDGAPVRLGGRTQRALLALLAVHAGELVPRARLHEELWPDADSASAARNVKSYVFALRKALGAAGGLVQTRPGGYLLDVAPEQLDASRFERLARAGRQALADGDPARAAEQLRSALALWRGDPLVDLAGEPFAVAPAGQLAALRLEAVEDRIEADLALGRHGDVVAELEAIVAAEPLRELPARQLMLALYRSGRQADALETFARARAALDELGLEPGPALRDLQTAILRQDPALDLPVRRPRRQLPAPVTALVGRRRELGELARLVREERVRLVSLTGPGGVGKTRLALDAAGELADAFEDGAAFVPLAPLRDAALVPAAIAETLQVREHGDHPLPELLANDLRTRRLLLVLDNFEHVDGAAPLLADLLAAAPELVALVTSRTPLRLYGEYEYRVPPLALDEAVPLFVARARAAGAAFDGGSPLVAAVCSRLDCLPLAIELVAARAPALSEAQLGSPADPLELASGGPRDAPERQQTLRAAIDWSHELLEEDERALFRRLSVFAGSCAEASARAVCSATPEVLARLVASSLLVVRRGLDGEPRFHMLSTIRDYAREQLDRSGETAEVAGRHARHYLELVEQVERELDGGGERAPLLDRLTEEHDNLRTALAWAHESGSAELELRLAASPRLFWELRGHLGEGRAWLAAALAREDDQPPEARAKAAHIAGVLAYLQGDLDETERLASESLAIYRKLGDDVAVGRALSRLGVVAGTRGDFGRAVELYEAAAAMLRERGDSPGLAVVLNNLGDAALKHGEFDRAAELLQEAAELQRSAGDANGRSRTLLTFGTALTLQGETEQAAATLEESLALAAEIRYPELIGYCLAGLGQVDLLLGLPERATRRLAAADAAFARIGAQMQPFERELYEAAVADARRALGDDAFAVAWAGGERLELEQAVAEARLAADAR
ncbi:MAG TPA: BTAD domain-containing putative transcriptional regulator [Gaiellaceae bacterium]